MPHLPIPSARRSAWLLAVVAALGLSGGYGATAIAAGGRPDDALGGFFVQPTVLTGVKPTMTVACEEVFGPVLAVIPFDTEDEAIALANDTRYGLAAAVWTGNLQRAHRVARAMEVGIAWVNDWFLRDLRTPFGGVKASGLGREGGAHSLDFYTQSRIVHVPLVDTHVPRFGA